MPDDEYLVMFAEAMLEAQKLRDKWDAAETEIVVAIHPLPPSPL